MATRAAPPAAPAPTRPALPTDVAERVVALLSNVPVGEDRLAHDLGLPAAGLAPILSELELMGTVARRPGGGVVLA